MPRQSAGVVVAAFAQALERLGWAEGRNVRIDITRAPGNRISLKPYAAELVALAPDVLSQDRQQRRPLCKSLDVIDCVHWGDRPGRRGLVQSFRARRQRHTGLSAYELHVMRVEVARVCSKRLRLVTSVSQPSRPYIASPMFVVREAAP